MQRLPLFPLGAVLVPGLVMPLHVFEPRYLSLMDHLTGLAPDDRMFGVVAIRAGQEVGTDAVPQLFDVGCTAVLRQVNEQADGTLQVLVTGGTRFRLHEFDPGDPVAAADPSEPGSVDRPGVAYPTGLVTPIPDLDGEGDVEGLAAVVGLRFAAYRERLGATPLELPESHRVLSYLVAAGMALDVADRQALLEQPDTARRLEAELALLAREQVLVEHLSAVPSDAGVHLGQKVSFN
jgi:Lon protease-like protein